MTTPKHDLEHEVYLDPKDGKEHINHGMLEYTEADLKDVHADYDEYHKNDEVNTCLLYTSPSPRDLSTSRMPSSA